MAFGPPQCAVNMEQRLAALRRDQEIDGLRVYLIKYNLFPRNRDPENSPIRVEELKELVKHWKLHRSRGFWRDHPEKDDLVRALLQHIRSEAANKKRRQEAQEKYSRKSGAAGGAGGAGGAPGGPHVVTRVGSGEMSEGAKHNFSMILNGGKEIDDDDSGGGGGGGGEDGRGKSFLARRVGGDLFYQRGDYDDGMIYLSRVDKSRFASDDEDPRNALLTTAAPSATPLDHLVHVGGPRHKPVSAASSPSPSPSSSLALSHVSFPPSNNSPLAHSPSAASLSRELKLKCVEGLYNMSLHAGFEAQMLREGALATLAAASLKSEDAALRVLAAATLLNLTAAPRELHARLLDDGALAALLELAHSPQTSVKTLVARALLRLTVDEGHHFRLVHEGVVVALTQLLAAVPNDAAHKQRCGHALVNLAAIPRAVTCDVLVATLVTLAKSSSDAAMLDGVAQALVNLSILPTTRGAMVEEGCLAALVVLAAAKRLPLSERVAHVLGNCAAIRTNQELMVKHGAPALVGELLDFVSTQLAALRGEEEEAERSGGDDPATAATIGAVRATLRLVRRHCANTLAHFCCNAKLSSRLVAAGVVPRVLGLWSIGRGQELDAETEKFCVVSVANLALDDRSRPALVQDGAVPLLLALLEEEKEEGDGEEGTMRTLLQLDAVTALSNLMLHPKNFTKMVDLGVVPALLARLRKAAADAAMRRACAYAMLTLAQDAAMQTKLVEQGAAVPTMLAFASSQIGDAELCGVSLSFFRHLSTRRENLEALFSEGTVALLVRVLQKKPQDAAAVWALWQPAMATLAQLATHAARRGSFLDDGVLEAMQHVLSSSSSATSASSSKTAKPSDALVVDTQFAAAQILCRLQPLCCGAQSQKHVDVPAFFASLLLLTAQACQKHSRRRRRHVATQHRTVVRCALAIARCTTSSPRALQTLARHADFPPALNGVLRTGLHEAQVCAAVALCNLASAASSLPRVWRDATPDDFIVTALLRLNRDETKAICAKALFNLLTHEPSRVALVQDGALYALLQLAARLETRDDVRDLALRALYNLSLGGAAQALLLAMEIVRVLAAMYRPAAFSTEMKRLLCGILSNLSAVTGHERQLLHEGALALLRPLARVRDPETKAYAANILYNLSCCEDVVELLVRGAGGATATTAGAATTEDKGGSIVTLLLALLKSENRDVRRYAALTLANLSGHSVALAALSGGDEPTTVAVLCDVLKRTMASCVETSAACVFALRNLLTLAENQQRFVTGDGVGTLAAVLASDSMQQSGDARTLHVATELLCGLATVVESGADERLAKDGIVRALVAVARGSASASAMPILTSLSRLSMNAACHELLLRDGALEAAALLARTNDASNIAQAFKGLVGVRGEEFAHHCGVLLRNLVHHSGAEDEAAVEASVKGQRLAGQPALVPMLLALAQSTSAETREHVVVALHNVARLRRCRLQLLKHDGVKTILRLATSATSAVKRHLCGLTLQLLSKPGADGDGPDPHLAAIKQEGIVAAIAAIAEPSLHHAHELPLLAAKAMRAVEPPRPVPKPSTLLITTGHTPVAQRGAPPDWAKVTITAMTPWPELERLATAVDAGTDDEVDGDDEYDGESEDEGEESAGKKAVPASPGHSRLRALPSPSAAAASSVTMPRTCSTDTVLGVLQLLEDESLDKVKVNVDAELAQRRGSSRGSVVAISGLEELPALRPATAPEEEAAEASSPKKRSTLSLVRVDAPVSPSKSAATPKRKSRTLEPLASPSNGRLGSSASTPAL